MNKDRLRTQLQAIVDLAPSSISTTEKLFSYSDVQGELDRIQKFSQQALSYSGFIDELPDEDANQLANELEGMHNLLSNIKQYRYDSNWLSTNYNQSIDEVRNRYRQLYKILIVPVREYANSIESNEAKLQELVAEVNKSREEFEKLKEDSAENVRKSQEATADISTVVLSQHFDSLLGNRINYSWSQRRQDYLKWRAAHEKAKSH